MQSTSALVLRLGYTAVWRLDVAPHFYTTQFLELKGLFLLLRHIRLGGHTGIAPLAIFSLPDQLVMYFSRYVLNLAFRNVRKRNRKMATPKLFKRRFYRGRAFGAFTRGILPRPRMWYWRKLAYMKFCGGGFAAFCRKTFLSMEWRYSSHFDDFWAGTVKTMQRGAPLSSPGGSFFVGRGFVLREVGLVPGLVVYRAVFAGKRTYVYFCPNERVLSRFLLAVVRLRVLRRSVALWPVELRGSRLTRSIGGRVFSTKWYRVFSLKKASDYHGLMKLAYPFHYRAPFIALKYFNLEAPTLPLQDSRAFKQVLDRVAIMHGVLVKNFRAYRFGVEIGWAVSNVKKIIEFLKVVFLVSSQRVWRRSGAVVFNRFLERNLVTRIIKKETKPVWVRFKSIKRASLVTNPGLINRTDRLVKYRQFLYFSRKQYRRTEDDFARSAFLWARPSRVLDRRSKGPRGVFSNEELGVWQSICGSSNFNLRRGPFVYSVIRGRIQSGSKEQFADAEWFRLFRVRRQFQMCAYMLVFFLYAFVRRPTRVFLQSMLFSVFGPLDFLTRRETLASYELLIKMCYRARRLWTRDMVFVVPFSIKFNFVYLLVWALTYFLRRTSQHKRVLIDFIYVSTTVQDNEIVFFHGLYAGVRGPIGKHARTKTWRGKLGTVSRNKFSCFVDFGQSNVDTLYGTLGLRLWLAL